MTRDVFEMTLKRDPLSVDTLYSDGGLIGSNPSKIGGTWAWVATKNDEFVYGESGVLLPKMCEGRPVTNNHTEFVAIIKALEAMPDGWSGTFKSDSHVSLGRFFKTYPPTNGRLFKMSNLTVQMMTRATLAVSRLGRIQGVLLGGHPTRTELEQGWKIRRGGTNRLPVSQWNKWCDEACTAQADAFKARING